MESQVQQLVEMGATVAQARAALKRYKDVMQAAERIFDGAFDDVLDEDGDVRMGSASETEVRDQKTTTRLATPEAEGDDSEDDADGADEEDEFVDYDSDYEVKVEGQRSTSDIDPYAGVFFSKDRREEVIEVEEEPQVVYMPKADEKVRLMTQSEWMKGCPEGGEQSFLFTIYSQLTEGKCPCPYGCGASVQRKKSDFFALYQIKSSFPKYIEQLQGIVRQKCTRCSKVFCFACGEPINDEKPPDAQHNDLFHCAGIQGVVLGIGLAMLEQLYHDQIQNVAGNSDGKARTSKRRKVETTPVPGEGDDEDDAFMTPPVQGSKKLKVGTGYAGDQKEDTTGQAEAQANQRAKDEKLGELMHAIRVYLPSLHRPGGGRTSDYLVHPTALAHLRRRFNNICSSLLRNDSLTDMSDRSAVYFELFEWLETISNHEALASMMAMPIMVASSVKTNTTRKSANGGPPLRERTIVYEGSSGPRELMEAIVIQANAAMKSLEGAKHVEVEPDEMTEEQKRVTNDTKGKAKEVAAAPLSEDNQKLAKFCRRILATAEAIDRSLKETKGLAFVQRLHDSLPKIYSSSAQDDVYADEGLTDDEIQKLYVDWATRVRFEYCDLTIPPPPQDGKDATFTDELPNYKTYFNNEARMLASQDIPKRSLAIAKELAVLTTNLPIAWHSSIFLRVDETRVDIIKALIIGPEDTPYQNGCFLFDIFLGHAYNQAPPSVKYMTTHGGKYRFNPNLYADGKVCLSLLGTWSGPGWSAGRSTLLQVLVSIQSMILCEEPYLNEPGWANSAGTPQSAACAYFRLSISTPSDFLSDSANIRRMVLKAAMLGNLKNPPEPFGDIIRTHFRLKARCINEQLDKWLAQDDGRGLAADGATIGRGATGGSTNGFAADVQEMKRLLLDLRKAPAGETVVA
ncbi:hypothetical protein EWM64_g951 [Hericium alpestre]|uniref:UBC core domain-containing protein n=1 Tax=Hericium alpestre TaxID=135208 RepID=A0A4Z0A9S9_9AGAM|nr:hypothetical protein EWM64_g951 [Hericium alpestre]